MSVAGCYVVHVQCSNPQHVGLRSTAEFTGEHKREALHNAQAAGWHVRWKAGAAHCPVCVKDFSATKGGQEGGAA